MNYPSYDDLSYVPQGRYTLTVEGTVDELGRFTPDNVRDSSGHLLSVLRTFSRTTTWQLRDRLTRKAPKWLPGDVVVVRFYDYSSQRYTYVRGAINWPGSRGNSKTDETMTSLWEAGKLKPVLQAGGEPFDESRL